MYANILNHPVYPTLLRCPIPSGPLSVSIHPRSSFSPTSNSSFLVGNLLRDRAVIATAEGRHGSFFARPVPHSPRTETKPEFCSACSDYIACAPIAMGALSSPENMHKTPQQLKFGVSSILSSSTGKLVANRSILSTGSYTTSFSGYNFTSPIAKPAPRSYMESPLQSLIACRTPYITGVATVNGVSDLHTINDVTDYSSGPEVTFPPSTVFPWVTARGKPRRGMMRRTVFSETQRQGLEKRFQIQKYISKSDRKKIAEKLGLKDSQVKIWFQNRRMKWRNSKERELLSSGGSREETLPTKANPNLDLSDVRVGREDSFLTEDAITKDADISPSSGRTSSSVDYKESNKFHLVLAAKSPKEYNVTHVKVF